MTLIRCAIKFYYITLLFSILLIFGLRFSQYPNWCRTGDVGFCQESILITSFIAIILSRLVTTYPLDVLLNRYSLGSTLLFLLSAQFTFNVLAAAPNGLANTSVYLEGILRVSGFSKEDRDAFEDRFKVVALTSTLSLFGWAFLVTCRQAWRLLRIVTRAGMRLMGIKCHRLHTCHCTVGNDKKAAPKSFLEDEINKLSRSKLEIRKSDFGGKSG